MTRKFYVLLLTAILAAIALTACTQYERDGFNPKPFNAPADWEYQPYGGFYN